MCESVVSDVTTQPCWLWLMLTNSQSGYPPLGNMEFIIQFPMWGQRLNWNNDKIGESFALEPEWGKKDLTLTLAAGSSHLYHVDSFNSNKLKELHDRVMEDTNVNPGSQYLTKVHNLHVNISLDAHVWP